MLFGHKNTFSNRNVPVFLSENFPSEIRISERKMGNGNSGNSRSSGLSVCCPLSINVGKIHDGRIHYGCRSCKNLKLPASNMAATPVKTRNSQTPIWLPLLSEQEIARIQDGYFSCQKKKIPESSMATVPIITRNCRKPIWLLLLSKGEIARIQHGCRSRHNEKLPASNMAFGAVTTRNCQNPTWLPLLSKDIGIQCGYLFCENEKLPATNIAAAPVTARFQHGCRPRQKSEFAPEAHTGETPPSQHERPPGEVGPPESVGVMI